MINLKRVRKNDWAREQSFLTQLQNVALQAIANKWDNAQYQNAKEPIIILANLNCTEREIQRIESYSHGLYFALKNMNIGLEFPTLSDKIFHSLHINMENSK